MTVNGAGIVFPGGAGFDALRAALAGHLPPRVRHPKEGADVLAVPQAALAGVPSSARRADRFSKMVLLAASGAHAGCGAAAERTGLILATALGPHATVFRFVNELLEYGDAKVSPTVFSQSVHAAALSMVAAALGALGPAHTVADLADPFGNAVALARAWLAEGRCDAVLVGAADELSDVLVHVVKRKWPGAVPGEGAVFFRFEREGGVPFPTDARLSPQDDELPGFGVGRIASAVRLAVWWCSNSGKGE
jgi:3-oxoacyl-(acyl-carrier-protein) synthase